MKQKGSATILIIILGIVLVAAIAGGAYYFGKSQTSNSQPQNTVVYQTLQPTPAVSATPVETANWKTYTITPNSSLGYASYQIKLPIMWKQIEHSSNFQGMETFQDGQNIYKLVIEEQKNYNDQTKKPFANLKELTGLPYDVTALTVDGQQALRPLPRAGSEYIYKALFFSQDAKLVYSITLETPSDGLKIREGEILFNQILSTFKFLDQNQTVTNNSDVCKLISDSTFHSVDKREVGLGPDGPVMGYWTIEFKEGATFQWMHSDMVEVGSYSCKNGTLDVTVKFPPNKSISVSYNPNQQLLEWDKVKYKKVK